MWSKLFLRLYDPFLFMTSYDDLMTFRGISIFYLILKSQKNKVFRGSYDLSGTFGLSILCINFKSTTFLDSINETTNLKNELDDFLWRLVS